MRTLSIVLLGMLLAGCANQNGSLYSSSGDSGGFGGSGGDEPEDLWAVRCIAFNGPDQARRAENAARQLKAVRGLRADRVQVRAVTGQTVVFYGRYVRAFEEGTGKEKFEPDPQPDLTLIRDLSMPVKDSLTGREQIIWPFRLAALGPLPAKPSSHPEWQLVNAPGYWSLQVGVFYNTETMQQRRFAAEEYCRLLREEGEEAWFDHGPVNSSVCIGSFPREAIQSFTRKHPLTGVSEVSARIVDEKMLAVAKRFPHNTHNGSIFYEITADPATGGKKRDPHPSFAVRIPKPATESPPARRRGG